MAGKEQVVDAQAAASVVRVGKQAIADEIRIYQSVQVQRSMPVLLFGNGMAVVIIAYINWQAVLVSGSYLAMAVVWILVVPMALSYLRLRKRPRPKTVSRRRIRLIEIHSLLMGLAWAAVLILLFPHLDSVNGVVVTLIMFFMGYGSVALIPSLPLAAAAYFLPIFLASFSAGYAHDAITNDIVIILHVTSMGAIIRTAIQNWRDVMATVSAGQEIAKKTGILQTTLENMGKA